MTVLHKPLAEKCIYCSKFLVLEVLLEKHLFI